MTHICLRLLIACFYTLCGLIANVNAASDDRLKIDDRTATKEIKLCSKSDNKKCAVLIYDGTNLTIQKDDKQNANISLSLTGDLNVTGKADIAKDTTFNSGITVINDATFKGGIDVADAVYFNNKNSGIRADSNGFSLWNPECDFPDYSKPKPKSSSGCWCSKSEWGCK